MECGALLRPRRSCGIELVVALRCRQPACAGCGKKPADPLTKAEFATDSPLEGDGFELSVPRERGYRSELSSVIYVPETVRVLPNKYTVATALAALVELHQ